MLPVAELNPINSLRPVLAIDAAVGVVTMPTPLSTLLASFPRGIFGRVGPRYRSATDSALSWRWTKRSLASAGPGVFP